MPSFRLNSAWRESLLPSYADHATRRGRAMEYSKKALDLHTRISWKRMSATSNEAKKAAEANSTSRSLCQVHVMFQCVQARVTAMSSRVAPHTAINSKRLAFPGIKSVRSNA